MFGNIFIYKIYIVYTSRSPSRRGALGECPICPTLGTALIAVYVHLIIQTNFEQNIIKMTKIYRKLNISINSLYLPMIILKVLMTYRAYTTIHKEKF